MSCVMAFFAMSGFVLARAYDGRPLAFVVRRVIRLWPLYAVCMVVGYAIIPHRLPSAAVMVWYPLLGSPNGAGGGSGSMVRFTTRPG